MQTFLKTVLPYVFCILAGYLAGAVNFAWLLAKKRGFDIRTKGSGNAGTTNAGRTMGSGVAAVVFLCDALKSALMVWLAGFLFHSSPSIQTVTMAACVPYAPRHTSMRGRPGARSWRFPCGRRHALLRAWQAPIHRREPKNTLFFSENP